MKNLFLILVVISLTGFGQTAEDYYNKGISKFNIKDYKGAISVFSLNWKSKFLYQINSNP